MDVNCKALQLNFGIGVRLGTCTTADGRRYLDVGGSIGPSIGAHVVEGHETRDALEPEARAFASAGRSVSVSTASNATSHGVGLGATVGARGLIPFGRTGVSTRPTR